MKVHLVGLPLSTHRRLKIESNNWKDAVPSPHLFRSSPISTNAFDSFTEGEIKDVTAAIGEGFTHIVIPANRDWKVIQQRFQFDCRIHLARLWEPLKDITWELLKERLHAVTNLDEIWLEKLSPKDLKHSLLLPPTIFSTMHKTHSYWKICDIYSEDRMSAAEQLLHVVEKEHWRSDRNGHRSWIDERKRRYRIDPSKHGRSVADRSQLNSYRFCFEIPPGFHYDVTEDNQRAFRMEIDGNPQTISHCNVTPWGHVRKG